MIKIIKYAFLLISGGLIWLVLKESSSIYDFIFGIIITQFAIMFSNKYLLLKPYHEFYTFRFTNLFCYIVFLFYRIFVSGIYATYLILTNKINPTIKVIDTELEDDLSVSLFANGITLTPGTITIGREDKKLTVLCITPKTKIDRFDHILLKGLKHD